MTTTKNTAFFERVVEQRRQVLDLDPPIALIRRRCSRQPDGYGGGKNGHIDKVSATFKLNLNNHIERSKAFKMKNANEMKR